MAHFLVEVELTAKPTEDEVLEQRAFLEKITKERSLLLAGVLPERPGKGMGIVKAPSIEAAKAIYNEAPLYKKGIIGWTLTEIQLTYGLAVGLE